MLAKRKAAFAAMLFFMCVCAGLPQTTEYIGDLKTSCKTTGTVEEGKTAVLTFYLTSDPMEGKLNYADICLKRGHEDAADSENGEAGKLHACTGEKIFSCQWQDPGNTLTCDVESGYVKSGYEFVGIVSNRLTLVIRNASRNQSGDYFVEDSSGYNLSHWPTCSLNVTGATEISGPGEDREEKPTQKCVQDTDGTWWLWLGSILLVVWTVTVICILGYIIWDQRDNKNLIHMVVQILKSIRDDNEGRATQHPRTNDESSVDGNTLPIDMGYEGRSRKNQSPQEANDDAATDSILNEEMPVDVEAQNPQQQPEQRPLLQVPMPVSDDQSCVYAESTN